MTQGATRTRLLRARRRARRGFSILELIVALAMLLILAGVTAPIAAAVITRNRIDDTRREMKSFVAAIQNYYWDCKAWPTSLSQLQTNSPAATGWNGPYATDLLSGKAGSKLSLDQDAWGQAYVLPTYTYPSGGSGSPITFTPPPSVNQITIRSKGPDQVANTADDLTQAIDVTALKRKETVDELNVLNAAIAAYNRQYLTTAPLPGNNMTNLFEALYTANLLVRPAGGATDPLKTDGWGTAYTAQPANVTPCVRLTSSNISGNATPPAGN
jgi:prepilin-type N-terminal cleavage/methylation domain-containing protein